MKHITKITVIGLVLVLLSGCAKRELKNNYFWYNGNNYQLHKGVLAYYGQNENGTHDFDLWFYSKSITFYDKNMQFEGSGELIYLDLNTTTKTGLSTYSYQWNELREPETIRAAVCRINYDMKNMDGAYYTATEAAAEIIKSDESYSIDFSLTLKNGKTVTGNYTGKFANASYTLQKKQKPALLTK